jgi:phosphoribosylaminoimidazole-succinocarboxamide synthase
MAGVVGEDAAGILRDLTLDIYKKAAGYARTRGIIIADTKLEFGTVGSQIVLADEVLTPDSSRFWPADSYSPGSTPPSFDKQYVRDWASETGWDKKPPGPELPPDVVEQTRAKYVEAYERITERSF